MPPQTIYFDESGYTGNNLLHESQQFFAYASVASAADEAEEFVTRAITDFRVQRGELKGSALLRYSKGRELIDSIIDRFSGRIKVSISSKKYALACKFFEYIFEPCVSEANSIFYGVGFHEFIANVLYLDFIAVGEEAETIFQQFEGFMRRLELGSEDEIFPIPSEAAGTGALSRIAEFARLNRGTIAAEMEGLAGTGVGKWILDLSNTCLFTLLANWGTEFPQITAICDNSRSLVDQQEIFDAMIGREGNQVFTSAFGTPQPITFNLSGPVQFVDSKVVHGVQIADAVAAAFVYALSNPGEPLAKKWRSLMPRVACYGSILPDFTLVDLSDPKAARNALLLEELCHRSRDQKSLTEGIGRFLLNATNVLALSRMVEPSARPYGSPAASSPSGQP